MHLKDNLARRKSSLKDRSPCKATAPAGLILQGRPNGDPMSNANRCSALFYQRAPQDDMPHLDVFVKNDDIGNLSRIEASALVINADGASRRLRGGD